MGLWVSGNKSDRISFNVKRIEYILNTWTWDKVHVLTDFDRTLTKGDSKTSWSLLMHSGLMPEGYSKKRMEYYNIYRPIEINYELPEELRKVKLKEWWGKHLELFRKFKLSEDIVNRIVQNKELMAFRNGAKEFLDICKSKDIPVIIISAGIGNFITKFLEYHNCLSENVKIISNFIDFENGVAVGFKNTIIHPLNKDEHDLPKPVKELITSRPNTIMLGDNIGDIRMILDENKERALKIGFLEEDINVNAEIFRENFDMVCMDNCSLDCVNEILIKYIKQGINNI